MAPGQQNREEQNPNLLFLAFLDFLAVFHFKEFLAILAFFLLSQGCLGLGKHRKSLLFWWFSFPFSKTARKRRSGKGTYASICCSGEVRRTPEATQDYQLFLVHGWSSQLRDPAAILFMSRDACSDHIAKLFRAPRTLPY